MKKERQSERDYSYIPGPSVYFQKPGAFLEAGAKVNFLGKKALVIADALIQNKYCGKLKEGLLNYSVETEEFTFSGECTYEESGRVFEAANGKNFDFLIGIGGGKTLDTVKLAGLQLKLPWVLLASSASTCAAWTAVAIVYNADGTFRDIVDTERAPAVTIVDESAVLEAPKELLSAGIGDSFAKYHEAKHVSSFKNVKKDELAKAALFTSAQMYAIIRNNKASKQKLITANIAMSGYVSTAGRNAASALFAHAFANSILLIPEARKVLHGYLAALGVVFEFQMLKKKFPDIASYKRLGLPLKFKSIGVKPTSAELEKIAELIKKDDSVEYFYPKIKLPAVISGLKKLL